MTVLSKLIDLLAGIYVSSCVLQRTWIKRIAGHHGAGVSTGRRPARWTTMTRRW